MVNYLIGLCLGFSLGVLVGGALYGRMSRAIGGGQVPPKTNPSGPPKRNPPLLDLGNVATPAQQPEAAQHTDWLHGRTAHLSAVIQQIAREPGPLHLPAELHLCVVMQSQIASGTEVQNASDLVPQPGCWYWLRSNQAIVPPRKSTWWQKLRAGFRFRSWEGFQK